MSIILGRFLEFQFCCKLSMLKISKGLLRHYSCSILFFFLIPFIPQVGNFVTLWHKRTVDIWKVEVLFLCSFCVCKEMVSPTGVSCLFHSIYLHIVIVIFSHFSIPYFLSGETFFLVNFLIFDEMIDSSQNIQVHKGENSFLCNYIPSPVLLTLCCLVYWSCR